ncbi:hypothetical protein HMPREF1624_00968 [Sporothrix schenckii ATCC 58251]|uniref:Inheritance of peroxisomes protein 1 n=1 Tax=Sporothrix schenckii (strain ATCC 58251 / de Perez 2211183) TaxID=1391915 RepID=U7Q652_SPOS1|nr:hypothetical protein HMPREF1624_00968 [Sporothrix schenckii ATCC 58251]
MGRAAGRDAAAPAPGPPRRSYTAPQHARSTSTSSHLQNHGVDAEAVKAAAAAAAMAAAAAAAEFGTSPTTSDVSSVTASSHHPQTTTSANGEAVETLYSHPAAKILSFTAGARNLDNIGSAHSRSAARSRRSLTTTAEDEIVPGTLPWRSQFDRTIAVGALSIYRAPGSVAFLSCGSALQPILPKSQCWCIDEESSKFILQIRRPQYWRIEVPVGDGGENDERARRLREVLDNILQFEKTPCPFKRTFTVELPEQPSTPLKKKPWTPVKRPEAESTSSGSGSQPTAHQKQQRSQSPPSLQERDEEDDDDDGSVLSSVVSSVAPPRQKLQRSQTQQSGLERPTEFSRREWQAMLESQKRGSAADGVDEFGRRLVPALVAEHEQRISDLKASEIEVNKMGNPWHDSGGTFSPTGGQGSGKQRDRALSLTSDISTSQKTAWPSIDGRWLEESDQSTTADSSSPFNSLRSWLSSAGGKALVSSPPSTAGSLADAAGVPPSLSSLYEDARRKFNNGIGTLEQLQQQQEMQQPRMRHRATTSSISVSNHAALPPAVNIIAPSHLRNLHSSGRATTRLEAMRRIPGSIIYKVFEILLAPPSYLLALMLKIAARILKGEWRGSAMGKNTDTGESISAQWDYSDVEDPLGRSTELTRPDHDVSQLNLYTEADNEVYTDAEDNNDNEDDDHDTAGYLSAAPSLKRSSSSASKAGSDSDDSDTLSDTGGDPIVWTRRWAID